MRNKNYLYFKDTSKNNLVENAETCQNQKKILFHSNQEQLILSAIALLSA